MSAQVAALALQRVVLRRAADDGLFHRAPPRTARMALHDSRWVDAMREIRWMARTRAPTARTRLGDVPTAEGGTK